jgi:hypothetical protein
MVSTMAPVTGISTTTTQIKAMMNGLDQCSESTDCYAAIGEFKTNFDKIGSELKGIKELFVNVNAPTVNHKAKIIHKLLITITIFIILSFGTFYYVIEDYTINPSVLSLVRQTISPSIRHLATRVAGLFGYKLIPSTA